MLRSAKDRLGLKVPDIYCIPCELGKVYVGYTEKSAVAEHSNKVGHRIDFNSIYILAKVTGYMCHMSNRDLTVP